MWDVWAHIENFIEKDKDRCRLMMTCKQISKNKFYFCEKIAIEKIKKSSWFNNFISVIISNKSEKISSNVTHLTFDDIF